ncbi:MAG TPA: hypothetical protein VHK47_15695 [Polyangia bacterium]|jgi:hypothetical protein|nr:hypothetical protein [Polyangia bacterium]
MKQVGVLVAGGVLAVGLGASGARAADNPGIVPIDANAQGRSYRELSAAWRKWAFETPAPESALLDTTGANCSKRQTDSIWFLAGTIAGGTVVRTCTVPADTYLFFPLANHVYGAFLTDPDQQRTEAFARSQTACILGAQIAADIDGVPVSNPAQYLVQSPLFTVQLPPNNAYGITTSDAPALTLDPAVDRGFYLFLTPLPPGRHTIHFASAPGSSCATAQDVTYDLTVAPR